MCPARLRVLGYSPDRYDLDHTLSQHVSLGVSKGHRCVLPKVRSDDAPRDPCTFVQRVRTIYQLGYLSISASSH
jgi:hypothetical protein